MSLISIGRKMEFERRGRAVFEHDNEYKKEGEKLLELRIVNVR
jgi:hypothetical protein